VIGQWTDNHLSALDAERVRLVYGTNSVAHMKMVEGR
jgi:hypothetical protein